MFHLYLLVCGGDMALVLNGAILGKVDPQEHDASAMEVFDRFCETLPVALSTPLVRKDLPIPEYDWTWDDLLIESGVKSQGPSPVSNSRVSNSIDGDDEVSIAKDTAESALHSSIAQWSAGG